MSTNGGRTRGLPRLTGIRCGRLAIAGRAAVAGCVCLAGGGWTAAAVEPEIRVGIIGLDTSHVVKFTEFLNRSDHPERVPGARVVAAYPQGSRDIESSVSRVAGYTDTLRGMGVEIVPSIDALVERVDAVLLESNDGRVHLEQAVPVLAAGRRLFIDKPMAASLADAIAIFRLAEHHRTPVFSASSLRFGTTTQAVRSGSIGDVLGCDVYSPMVIEPTHPDLFWYGIHGCEALFTVMGTGCQTVRRTSTVGSDLITGVWDGGRIGTYRGLRAGHRSYGGTVFGATGVAPVGESSGYRPLVVEIVQFLRTGAPPVLERETVELLAFMEAADESQRRDGATVAVADIIAKAEATATALVEQHRRPTPAAPANAAAP
jgi:predicted dehydrogenase